MKLSLYVFVAASAGLFSSAAAAALPSGDTPIANTLPATQAQPIIITAPGTAERRAPQNRKAGSGGSKSTSAPGTAERRAPQNRKAGSGGSESTSEQPVRRAPQNRKAGSGGSKSTSAPLEIARPI